VKEPKRVCRKTPKLSPEVMKTPPNDDLTDDLKDFIDAIFYVRRAHALVIKDWISHTPIRGPRKKTTERGSGAARRPSLFFLKI
jgi:hypothetical protein